MNYSQLSKAGSIPGLIKNIASLLIVIGTPFITISIIILGN